MPTAESSLEETNSTLNSPIMPKPNRNILAFFFLVFVLSSLFLIYLLKNPYFDFRYFLSKITQEKNGSFNSGPTKIFTGHVVRVLTSKENFILEVTDLQATSAASRLTRLFRVKKESSGSALTPASTESASKNVYKSSFGDVQVGDTLKLTYFGNTSPYNVNGLDNLSAKNNSRQPAFMHGFVTVVSGDILKMYSTDGGEFTLKVEGTVLIGPMYEVAGKVERPGKLNPVTDFSGLKVGQEISVFYSRNFAEIIIPDRIMTL